MSIKEVEEISRIFAQYEIFLNKMQNDHLYLDGPKQVKTPNPH